MLTHQRPLHGSGVWLLMGLSRRLPLEPSTSLHVTNGHTPDQLAAALDLEVLRWRQTTAGMKRERAWQVVTDLLTLGGAAR